MSMIEEPQYIFGQPTGGVKSMAARTVAGSAGYLRSSLEPHMKILDVGCGPGSITIDLAKHVPYGHIIGVDTESASATLDKARALAAKEGATNVEFRVGDGRNLPFPDASFDVVHSNQVIQYLDDPVLFLREMRRVAKPGGLIACRAWDLGFFQFHPRAEPLDGMAELMRRCLRETGREPYAGRNLHIWARQAGFDPSRMKVSSSNSVFRTPEERQYWATFTKSFGTQSDIVKFAVSKGFTSEEKLMEVAEAFDQWAEDEDGWFIQVDMEILCRV